VTGKLLNVFTHAIVWFPLVFTVGSVIFAVPLKLTPFIVLAVVSLVAVVAVAAFHVTLITAVPAEIFAGFIEVIHAQLPVIFQLVHIPDHSDTVGTQFCTQRAWCHHAIVHPVGLFVCL